MRVACRRHYYHKAVNIMYTSQRCYLSFILLVWSLVASFVTKNQAMIRAGCVTCSAEKRKDTSWRDFRAQLVLQERCQQQKDDHHHWAYDSGHMIEEGSIILSCCDQDFGYGVSQQYFHKSVILVLEHDDNEFTKGIILNRPSNLVLWEEFESNNADGCCFRLWYGGEVAWLDSGEPDVICLHSLENDPAKSVSKRVIPGSSRVQCTSLQQAAKLVEFGYASVEDFLVFGGYAGWYAGQLQDELDRDSWYMVATDADTVWNELRKLQKPADTTYKVQSGLVPGADMWARLMKLVGKESQTRMYTTEDFDNLMLAEWAKTNLLFGGTKSDHRATATSVSEAHSLQPGVLLQGNSESEFLLSDQLFYKSTLLILDEEVDFTVAVALNHPVPDKLWLDSAVSSIPVRFGGRFGEKRRSEKPTFFFHNNQKLRDTRVGKPVRKGDTNGIWVCTEKDVLNSIRSNIALEADFLCVRGLTIWPKTTDSGLPALLGSFRVVPSDRVTDVWKILQSQQSLTTKTLDQNLACTHTAWKAGGGGLGANEVTLSDRALRSWAAAFLLGEPSLRHSSG